MHHDHHVVLLRELQLLTIGKVLGLGNLVVADLADGHDALLEGKARQHLKHLTGKRFVVRFFGIQSNGTKVSYAELGAAEALPAD